MKTANMDQQFWGVAEIAIYFGITKQRISNWRKRHSDRPKATELKQGPVYVASEIKVWVETNFPDLKRH